MNDRLGTVLRQCLVGSVGHVAVAIGDVHGRQAADLLDVEFRIDGMTFGRQAEPVGFTFHHHAHGAPGALEGFSLDVDGFAHVATGLDFIVHGHQHAFATRLFVAGHGHGVVEVEHAVGGHRGARAHGTHYHDRFVGLFHQVEEEGGLFQGIGAVGDDDAVDILAVGQLGDTLAQLEQVFVADAFRSDLHHLLAAYIGQVGQFRYAGDQFVDAELGGLVSGAVGGARARAGNGAAGGEDDHIGEFLLGLDVLGPGAGRQDQQQREGAGGEGLQCGVHHYCFLSFR
ncbi:hypothetical protein D3C81_669450 [compost metagenome]